MDHRIMVVPNTTTAIGMRHPIDGPLEASGSLWTHDIFTIRRLHDGSVRHAEAGGEILALSAEDEADVTAFDAGQDAAPKPAKSGKAAKATLAETSAAPST